MSDQQETPVFEDELSAKELLNHRFKQAAGEIEAIHAEVLKLHWECNPFEVGGNCPLCALDDVRSALWRAHEVCENLQPLITKVE